MSTFYVFCIQSINDFYHRTGEYISQTYLSKLEETSAIHEYLQKTFNAYDLKDWKSEDLRDALTPAPVNKHGSTTFVNRFYLQSYDIIAFKVPKEEGRYVAFYKKELLEDSLLPSEIV